MHQHQQLARVTRCLAPSDGACVIIVQYLDTHLYRYRILGMYMCFYNLLQVNTLFEMRLFISFSGSTGDGGEEE